MNYESGFAQGERDAFRDRLAGVEREMLAAPQTDEERGYWDAYWPRSATWAAQHTSPRAAPAYEEAA